MCVVTPCKQKRLYHHRLTGKSCMPEQFHHLAYPFKCKLKNDVCYWLLIYNVILKMSLWLSGVGNTPEHSLRWEHLDHSRTNSTGSPVIKNIIYIQNIWKWCHGPALQHWRRNDSSVSNILIQKTDSWNISFYSVISDAEKKPLFSSFV